LLVYTTGGTLAECDPFGIPSTLPWTAAAIDLKLVNRQEFGSGAVAMRYEPRR